MKQNVVCFSFFKLDFSLHAPMNVMREYHSKTFVLLNFTIDTCFNQSFFIVACYELGVQD